LKNVTRGTSITPQVFYIACCPSKTWDAKYGTKGFWEMRKWIVAASLLSLLRMAILAQPDEALKVRNAAEALDASLAYLQEHYPAKAPAAGIQWSGKTIFSGGPVDLATTARQFTGDAWSVEVTEGLAPLKNIVYEVMIFSPTLGSYWKGRVKADGSVREDGPLRQLSDEEKQKTTEEFLKRSRIPPPQGGYGH
jgi:hypothetical protein